MNSWGEPLTKTFGLTVANGADKTIVIKEATDAAVAVGAQVSPRRVLSLHVEIPGRVLLFMYKRFHELEEIPVYNELRVVGRSFGSAGRRSIFWFGRPVVGRSVVGRSVVRR